MTINCRVAAEFLELPLLRGSISDLSLPKTSRFRPVGFVSSPEASPVPSFQVWGVPETSLLTRVLPSPQHRECPEAPEPVQAGGFVEEAAFSPGLSAGGEGARTQDAGHSSQNRDAGQKMRVTHRPVSQGRFGDVNSTFRKE